MAVRVHTSDERRFMSRGFNPLDSLYLAIENIPTDFPTGDYICPYANGCLGAKDAEFHERCSGKELSYLECNLYKLQTGESRVQIQLPRARNPGRKPQRVSFHDSIDGGLDEGAPIDEVVELLGALRHHNSGRIEEYSR